MKKIVLAGIMGLKNVGEQYIADCCDFLVKKNIDIETCTLDFSQRSRNFRWYVLGGLTLFARIVKNYKLEFFLYKIWHNKRFCEVIKESDGVIFACGSFKYGTQNLWAGYSAVIEIAHQYNIPVMFNAMNIQKYSSNNEKCKILKEHLNYSNVKIFSTRDGYMGVERLSKSYIQNECIEVFPVGDVAFCLDECYGLSKDENSDVIGINLIDGDVFRRYGKKLNEEQLMNVYIDFITELEKNNHQWELFTNGLPGDYEFGIKLLRRINKSDKKIYEPISAIDAAKKILEYKIILGARLHASICAYSLGVPVVGFVWDDKLDGFVNMAKIEQFFLQENELTGSRLYDLLIRAMDFKYDDENKDYWKKQTYDTIKLFLEKYC